MKSPVSLEKAGLEKSGLEKVVLEKGNLEQAVAYARRGMFKKAIACFEERMAFTADAAAMSCYAWCLAAEEKQYKNAVTLAFIAAKREFYNPEVFLNLGRVLVLCGRKGAAVKAFKKGLALDSKYSRIWSELRLLGLRRPAPLGFLPRSNFINIYIGLVVHRVRRAVSAASVVPGAASAVR